MQCSRLRHAASTCAGAILLSTSAACASSGGGGPNTTAPPRGPNSAAPTLAATHAGNATPPTFEIDALTGMKFSLPSHKAPGGTVTLKLVDKATDNLSHEAELFQLAPGVSPAKFTHELLAPKANPLHLAGARTVGGPGGVEPGHSASVTVHLKPNSTYGLICQIPATDGKPHYMHGMIATFTTGADNGIPMPDVHGNTIVMTDDKFTVPADLDWTKPIAVRNEGKQVHQAQLLGPVPGKTVKDIRAYLNALASGKPPAGPPPYLAVGGAGATVPGHTQVFTPSLKPGHYVLICLMPDVNTHKLHFAMGMIDQFTVS